jgi:hypothetical protein
VTRHLRVITNSELTVHRRCPREHHYAYVQGYRPVEKAGALAFGSRWHVGMETWWRGDDLDAVVLAATAECADPYESATLRALLTGYEARWRPEHDQSRVVAVEVEFRMPLSDLDSGEISAAACIGGKIDVLLADGIVEHKTTSDDISAGSAYWRVLSLNTQVSTYYAGARALGVEPRSCTYDVVKKPTIKPLRIPLLDEAGMRVVLDSDGDRVLTKDAKKWRETGDSKLGYVLQTRDEAPEEYCARLLDDIMSDPDKYYQRGEVVRLDEEEREAARDMWSHSESVLSGTTRPRNPDACRRYGSLCPYFEVCTGEASLDDAGRFRLLDSMHEELA